MLLFSTLINLNIHGSSRKMYLYYFNESDNKFQRLTVQAFFITYCFSKKSSLPSHRTTHKTYRICLWNQLVHLIHVLCLGDLNYVSSVYWQTLRSFTIKYKQASTCSKSAKQTSEQDSKFVLSPKTDIITYQFTFETIR